MTNVDLWGDFGSLWLQALDCDPPIVEVIASAESFEFEDRGGGRAKKKVVLYFKGETKPLPLNTTNRDTLMDLFNLGRKDALDKVIGKKIKLWCDRSVVLQGRRVAGVRICAWNEDPFAKRGGGGSRHPGETVYDTDHDSSIDTLQSEPEWEAGRE
jgi:hypothetical protein